MSAIGFYRLAEVGEKAADGTTGCGGESHNAIQARQILLFPGGEKSMQPIGDLAGFPLLRSGKQAESVAQAGWLDFDIARFFEVAESFQYALAGCADFFC
jgi:hypothetical protein